MIFGVCITERQVEEGRMDDKTVPNPIQTEAWEEVDPQPSTEWEDHQLHQVIHQ